MSENVPIGPWTNRKPFYDGLTLRANGDAAEQRGALVFDLDRRFPEYERFWKYHIAPATQRPHDALAFNPNVDDAIVYITQRSYSVFAKLLKAHSLLERVGAQDYGEMFENWSNTIGEAGDAIQRFHDLRGTIAQLSALVGSPTDPFPDWSKNWKDDCDALGGYRHYETHQGEFQIFVENDMPYVLKREKLADRALRAGVTWNLSISDFQFNRGDFTTLIYAAVNTVDETTAWLNKAYERINATLDPLLSNPNYDGLRGNVPLTAHARPQATGQSTGLIGQHVGAYSGVRTVPALFVMCGTTTPPPPENP
ncbi:MAG: hypothetical protein KF708_04015 [Pirellulales bacterium]|nr:hypothetical protein [Pirellulales bacterium]